MYMKKRYLLLTALLSLTSILAFSQDDMYYTTSKNTTSGTSVTKQNSSERYVYNQNPRDVDEYNGWGDFSSRYDLLDEDSLLSDVIELLPDSLSSSYSWIDSEEYYDTDEDYKCSRLMSRFDDFYWYNPWYYGWYGPYYYSRYWWYDPWYDPWYYSWYGWYGWHSPWYYGWSRPLWHGGGYRPYIGGRGTRNHSLASRGGGGVSSSRSSANRPSSASRSGKFSGSRQGSSARQNSSATRSGGSFGGSRSTSTFGGTRSSSSMGGGGHSGGGSFGGGRSGGGGSFGGGHSGGRR